MKVLVNGGLNLSELDGWWAEAYAPDIGWAIGDAREHGDDPAWDAREAEELYRLLEEEVVPTFYARNELCPQRAGHTDGLGRAYAREHVPLDATILGESNGAGIYAEPLFAVRGCLRSAIGKPRRFGRGPGAVGKLRGAALARGEVRALQVTEEGGAYQFLAHVYLGELAPDVVRVELYAEPRDGGTPSREPMLRKQALTGAANAYAYRARVPAERPASDYTPRILPHHPQANLPLEFTSILWLR
jgi:starch phosphorylase